MRFPRQEYWSGLPFSSLGDLPSPGIEPRSSTLQANSLPSEPPGKPHKFSSVAQSCLTPCNPTDRSMLGLPAYHQLPNLAQTQVHRVSDAIQPSHPLLSPSPTAFNLPQHQGLFQ